MNISDQMNLVSQAMETAPVNVKTLAVSLGISVHEAYLDSRISGMLECKDGKYKISVNVFHPETRKRFTIAHELGHYILHRELIGNGVDDTTAYRSEEIGKYHNTDIGPHEETQANRFAAGLLMPTKLVIDAIKKGMDLDRMAEYFGVSRQSMDYRVQGMDIPRN
ncbi:MAG: ImmA/IrrE family metallo-endopeptidase [Gammaproteobacteria bacterium]|nr:ImmA/IrrE family metallo-endopeptidase [Gammaproteobacteria bacterium]MYG67009.1 ImmA/IrrE family metallo-endopeptidase [Gammaproteobacteria bacterium]